MRILISLVFCSQRIENPDCGCAEHFEPTVLFTGQTDSERRGLGPVHS